MATLNINGWRGVVWAITAVLAFVAAMLTALAANPMCLLWGGVMGLAIGLAGATNEKNGEKNDE